ncbi:Uridine kinase [Geodia barretti]|uniref:Uridine kinase n=1 Tax=Geodia barretti TaxID=519541 RepID=A0AA35RKE1_GEOBA|nr:Uridine kinase [Geodia barretti]
MGGSASGKTTFAKALAEALSEFSPVVLNQDTYFRDWSEYSDAERERVITANHPDAVLWDALITDIKKLRARDAIDVPTPVPVVHNAATKRRACNRAMLSLWKDILSIGVKTYVI